MSAQQDARDAGATVVTSGSSALVPTKASDVRADTSALGHMIHLDGIRAMAVIAVIVEHWASGLPRPIRTIIANLDLGGWGVECFFVLSGFLITLLLLKAKAADRPLATTLGHFYSRRALRIFPAYYLVLGIGVLSSPAWRQVGGWLALYLGNLYPLVHGGFTPVGGHFWSLAVEEQFYLFWPLIVLLTPNRRLQFVTLALCLLAPLTRWWLWYAMGGIHLSMWTFPTTALDLLGFGAFLACVKHQYGLSAADPFVRRLRWSGSAAFIFYLMIPKEWRSTVAFAVLDRSLVALIFGALILQASFGLTGPGRHLLGNPLVVWLGVVSYGLYIFHPYIPPLYIYILSSLDLSADDWGVYYIRFPALVTLLLTVVSLSFYLWESPIRQYRRYFG
jgi:peptidoglycan/LPS O-acetylase OafA/YrhL